MKKYSNLILISLMACIMYACNHHRTCLEIYATPEIPYQEYLDSIGKDDSFPTIGDDGEGFNAISHHIRYPEIPDTMSISQFADSLLQFYNIAIALNTVAYDVSTAERYMENDDIRMRQADALDSINVSGIHYSEIREKLVILSRKAAQWIRSGKKPNEQINDEVDVFYQKFNAFIYPLFKAHMSDDEFNPWEILNDYASIHSKAISDSTSFQKQLLQEILREYDFDKKCVLAREYAYMNHKSHHRDYKELVAILDPILRANEYSPLLGELWLMWRTALQKYILSGPSNDSAMYNLFYNDMRNRVALVYIKHLATHPNDKLAFNAFARLAMVNNITRNSECLFGNNSLLDEISLYRGIVDN